VPLKVGACRSLSLGAHGSVSVATLDMAEVSDYRWPPSPWAGILQQVGRNPSSWVAILQQVGRRRVVDKEAVGRLQGGLILKEGFCQLLKTIPGTPWAKKAGLQV
jgi:hypothetical protein